MILFAISCDEYQRKLPRRYRDGILYRTPLLRHAVRGKGNQNDAQHLYHGANVSTNPPAHIIHDPRSSLATERYPLLRTVFEDRNNFGGNTRLILVGFIAMLGLFALAARGSMMTIPILVVIGAVVLNFRRLERVLSGGAREWRRFLALVDSSPVLKHQVEMIEQELAGESIEWSRITMTENYIIWPRELHRGHITLINDITLLHVGRHEGTAITLIGRRQSHQFMCDTRYAGERLTLSLDEDESSEILQEILARHPEVQIDPFAHSYFYPPSVRVEE